MNKEFNSKAYNKKFIITSLDKIRIDKILHMIGIKKDVLDIGCGDGFMLEKIKKTGNFVSGIELAENALLRARKRGFKVYSLDLNGNWSNRIKKRFDVVLAGEIIEHIFDTDKFLQNIRKVLKENGYLVLTTPNIASLGRRIYLLLGLNPIIEYTARPSDAGHIRYFTRSTLSNLLKENGYKIEQFDTCVINFGNNGRFYSQIAAKIFPSLGNNLMVKASKKAFKALN